jgi:hypothetical protein
MTSPRRACRGVGRSRVAERLRIGVALTTGIWIYDQWTGPCTTA